MKMIPSKHRKIAFALLLAGILLAAFQVLCAVFFYDTSVRLYDFGIVPKILNILLAVYAVGVFVVFKVLKSKDYPETPAKSSIVTCILSALCAVAILISGIGDLITFFKNKADITFVADRQDTFVMWSGILSLGAAAYFVINAIFKDSKKTLKAWFGFVTVIWHIMFLLSVYFDMSSPLNDPIRLINEFAFVAGMLFLAAELRYSLGFPKKGSYIAFSLIAVTFLLASGITGIVCTYTEMIPKTREFWGYVFEFVFAFYVLYSFISQLLHTEEIKEEKKEIAPSILETEPEFKNYL